MLDFQICAARRFRQEAAAFDASCAKDSLQARSGLGMPMLRSRRSLPIRSATLTAYSPGAGREGAAVADDQDASSTRSRVPDDIRGEHLFPGFSQGNRLGIVVETIPE